MTEDGIAEYLWALINTGVISTDPEVMTVDDESGEGLTIEVGEDRFAITVRRIGPALGQPVRALDDEAGRAAYEARRSDFDRMIEEGYLDLERNGCVPAEEVERSCRDAIARGLARREARLRIESRRVSRG